MGIRFILWEAWLIASFTGLIARLYKLQVIVHFEASWFCKKKVFLAINFIQWSRFSFMCMSTLSAVNIKANFMSSIIQHENTNWGRAHIDRHFMHKKWDWSWYVQNIGMNVYVFWLLNVAFFFQSECTLAWEAVWNSDQFTHRAALFLPFIFKKASKSRTMSNVEIWSFMN